MNRIRDLREDRELRQIDLAKATGIDQRTISNYETGKSNPDSFALVKLADYFGVSIDYLVGRTAFNFYSDESKRQLLDQIVEHLKELRKVI